MDDFPTKNRKRARRRFLKQKFKQRAKKIAAVFGWSELWAIKHADNLKSCNCFMCRNPRKQFKEKTLQEKMIDEKFKDELNDRM